MPPYLKKSINEAHLDSNRFQQIVSDPKMRLELNGLEASDELQINTVTQQATQQNPTQLATTAKIQVTVETTAVNSNEKKTRPKTKQVVLSKTTIKIVVQQSLTPTKNSQECQRKQYKYSKRQKN